MARKKHRLREGSLAWYTQKCWWQVAWYCRKYWKLVVAAALAAAVTTALMVAILSFYEGKEPAQANSQQPHKTRSVSEYEPIPVLADVPLDADLQLHIADVCEDYHIEPELVLAVIGQESNYRHCLIGDDGESMGLMQVQEKWHKERMERMKVTDLMNPYENVIIGVDYLAECIEKGGLEWGLMAYNGGAAYANEKTKQGVVTDYAEGVLMLYEMLKGGK